MIRILIVDQQRLFSEAIQKLVEAETDMKVIGIITSEEDVLEDFKKNRPDIILMDIHMLSLDGFRTIQSLKESVPSLKVVYLTSKADKELLITAIVAGSDGFLYKNLSAEGLIRSLRSVYDDQFVISRHTAHILAQEIIDLTFNRKEALTNKLILRDISLTDREVDVALLMMDNLPNKKIAKKLSISEGTTKNYVSSIYEKIGLSDRKHLIAYLRGLFSQDNLKK